MNTGNSGVKRLVRAVLPAFLLAVSVGQVYAFTVYSTPIAERIGRSQKEVQFAFSLAIFFLGTGAAFFGKIVERNIRLSTAIGTVLFLGGLAVTSVGVSAKSLALVYLGYGVMLGTGTGIIYISPVKTMMLWFPHAKALAAALPIISFGLGATLSTLLYNGIRFGTEQSYVMFRMRGIGSYGVSTAFLALVCIYAGPMIASVLLLRKPGVRQMTFGHDSPQLEFSYGKLFSDRFFLRSWLFMFLNISCGLCLIPLARQMMTSSAVGYSEGLVTGILALCGLFNGGGRFLFAWVSDRLRYRIDVLLIVLGLSAGVMTLSLWPVLIGLALLVVNACYGAGFSVMPAILADHFSMTNISKIHGAVLSAWGVAGLVGNQAAIFVSERLGLGYPGVVVMLIACYALNALNVWSARRASVFQSGK